MEGVLQQRIDRRQQRLDHVVQKMGEADGAKNGIDGFFSDTFRRRSLNGAHLPRIPGSPRPRAEVSAPGTRAISSSRIEGANPRHEHEWEAWTTIKLPDDKILIPGVIGSNSKIG